jgi:hypothetical protein
MIKVAIAIPQRGDGVLFIKSPALRQCMRCIKVQFITRLLQAANDRLRSNTAASAPQRAKTPRREAEGAGKGSLVAISF